MFRGAFCRAVDEFGLQGRTVAAALKLTPLLPIVAFWAAWFSHRAVELVAVSAPLSRGPAGGRARSALGVVVVLLAGILAFRDVPGHVHRFTLEQQRALVRRIAGPPESTVMAFSAAEVYALSERPSPNPFLQLHRTYVPLLPIVGLRSCNDVLARVLEQRPRAVAIRPLFLAGGCEPGLGTRLVAHGYSREETRLGIVVYWSPGHARGRQAGGW